MSTLSPTTEALLALIAEHGPISRGEMLELPESTIAPILEDTRYALQTRIAQLCERGLVRDIGRRKVPTYEATSAGLRWLTLPQGSVATSRAEAPAGHYAGGELRPFTGRPGAMDAFTKPSLEGGTRVERRRPTTLGSTPGAIVR